MKSKTTKRALLLSVLSLLVCVAMLIGTTYAWFTDSVTTGVNSITSGTLDIDVVDASGNSVSTLSFVNKDGSSDILWEPGATFELDKSFKIINKGDLYLKYKVELTAFTGDTELLNAIDLTVNGQDWDSFWATQSDLPLAPNADSGELTVSGTMSKEAGNEYMGKTLNAVEIKVYATQQTAEFDSISDLYDKDATYPVSTADELVDAIQNGKVASLIEDVSLNKIDLTNGINEDVAIDANGHKITTSDSYAVEVTPGKNVTLTNADVEITKEGTSAAYAAGFKIANGDYEGATITLKNCEISMANGDWSYAVNMPAGVQNLNLVIDNCTLEGALAVQCWGDGNTITITNSDLICNYTTSAMYTSHCVALQADGSNSADNNTLVIDNCAFSYSGVDNFDSTIYSVKDYGVGNALTVTNCTYGAKVAAY